MKNRPLLNSVFWLLACGLMLSVSTASAKPIAIAHPGVADGSVSGSDLKNMFLNKKTSWSDGSRVVLATQKSGGTHDAFLKAHVGKSPSQFKSFWRKLVFTGKAKLPKAFASDADVISYVKSTQGALGYIDDGTPHDGVKVVK